MASAGNLLRSELLAGDCSVAVQPCPWTACNAARCSILPANSCQLKNPIVRLASTRKQRSLVLTERTFSRVCKATSNGAMSWNSARGSPGFDVEKHRSRLEAFLYSGKEIPEEKIEKPTGVPTHALPIGNKPMCVRCEAKGAIWCPTCAGSGLYVDSILESQGIIVKVKCLGCGGTGSTMCPKCGGRGHSEI